MKLYLDISEFISNRILTGIQRVVSEFIKRADKDEVKLLVSSSKEDFYILDFDEVLSYMQDIKNYHLKSFEKLDLTKESVESKIFLDIDSVWNTQSDRKKLYKKLKKYNFKIANFIYDLIPLLYPQFLYKKSKENFPKYIEAVTTHSDMVFFDSLSAKNDFITYTKRYNKKLLDTSVIYPGADFYKVAKNYKNRYEKLLKTKYILFVGTIEPRKKQLEVLKAFDLLSKKHKDLNLIFIGRLGWETEKFLKYLREHLSYDKNIFYLQDISDEELSLFYQKAYFVTYVSEYEGYGLPVAESLFYGNITIVSDNSSMREVGGDLVEYLPKNKDISEAIADIIRSYLKDKNSYLQRKKMIKSTYIPRSWDDFYHSLIKSLKKLES